MQSFKLLASLLLVSLLIDQTSCLSTSDLEKQLEDSMSELVDLVARVDPKTLKKLTKSDFNLNRSLKLRDREYSAYDTTGCDCYGRTKISTTRIGEVGKFFLDVGKQVGIAILGDQGKKLVNTIVNAVGSLFRPKETVEVDDSLRQCERATKLELKIKQDQARWEKERADFIRGIREGAAAAEYKRLKEEQRKRKELEILRDADDRF